MSLYEQIKDVANEIAGKRLELDKLYNCSAKGDYEWDMIRVLESELDSLQRDIDRANRWLSVCGVVV